MRPQGRWKTWGDKAERRRLIREGLWYEPKLIDLWSGEALTGSVRELIGDRWAARPMKIGDGHLVCSLDFCRFIAFTAASELNPDPGRTPCALFAKHAEDAFRWFANSHWGPHIAAWKLAAKPIHGHGIELDDPSHAFILALTRDAGWVALDVAFRQVYEIAPEDGGFSA